MDRVVPGVGVALPHSDAVDLFVERVEAVNPNAVERLSLFGSVARGTQRPDSDIDVFAVLDDGADVSATEERLRDIAYDITLDGGPGFSIHAETASTVEARADRPFSRTVFDEGRPIYG